MVKINKPIFKELLIASMLNTRTFIKTYFEAYTFTIKNTV